MGDRKIILVVDDAPENLTLISSILKDKYKVKVATGGDKAIAIIARAGHKPDLILLDIMMPGKDGFAVCAELKAMEEAATIPVIFLTSLSSPADETKGLEIGAVDYIHKPINPAILLARVQTHLKLKEASDFLAIQNTILEKMVKQRTLELAMSQQATIVAMGALAEYRDPETGNHLLRTQHYVKALAVELAKTPTYHDYLTEERIDILFRSAPLHDIGKVGIPDSVLLKPAKLTLEEFEIMKGHTIFGKQAIHEAQLQMGAQNTFLLMSEQIAESHHEKWDGSGYPNGLKGTKIPLSARVMAIADAYDAMVSHRVYKSAISHEETIKRIQKDSGSHFDPKIVDCFLRTSDTFKEIQGTFSDASGTQKRR